MVHYGVLGAVGGATAKDLESFVVTKVPTNGKKQVYSLYNSTKSFPEKLFCKGKIVCLCLF